MESVMNVFSRPSGPPLYLGAVKAAVGHGEAAAGIVAVIKTVLMLQKGAILAQPSQPIRLNRQFRSLEGANVILPSQTQQWIAQGERKRMALVNGFDAAAGNTSIILEEGFAAVSQSPEFQTHHIVAFSGHTETALQKNKRRMLEHILARPETQLRDLAYTTMARRIHERVRQAYVVESVDSLARKLSSDEAQDQPESINACKVAFLFTGQSAQYTGMGATLYQTCPHFRGLLDSYQTLCSAMGLSQFVNIIRGLLDLSIATASQQQLSIVALEIALAEYWRSLGLEPNVVLGHSLGEYAALCVAGVLSASSTFYLVHKRAELMDEMCGSTQYGMLATGLTLDSTRQLADEDPTICVACINGPSSTVISGEVGALDSQQTKLKSQGISAVKLKVQHGFHSPQMDPILDGLEQAAQGVEFMAPQIPIASTCTGKVVREAGVFNANYLRAQTRQPVNFLGAVRACEEEGLLGPSSFAIEIGPQPVCAGLLPSCLGSATMSAHASLQREKQDWQVISTALAAAYCAGLPVNWTDFHKDFKGSARLLDLPTYAWDLTDFWTPYKTKSSVATAGSPGAIISPSVQRVESLRQENGRSIAVFLSNTAEPVLYQAIQGHAVSGCAICPASVFMDMAYTAARHLFDRAKMEVPLTHMGLQDLKMTQALLVPRQDPTQIVRITATLNLAAKTVAVRFQSVDGVMPSGIVDHGYATIVAGEKTTSLRQWAQMRRLVQGRATALASDTQAHRMTTPLIYKLFASMVDYSKPYQALREAHIDPSFQDAMATIALGSAVADVGNFTYSPFILDALVHLVGFLLNADLNKSDNDLHMANSIGSLHILEPLRAERGECVVYASIRHRDARTGVSLCDVFVFDQASGGAVAICSDIRFQRLPPEVVSSLVLRKPEAAVKPAILTPETTTPAHSASRSPSPTPKTLQISRSGILLELTARELGIESAAFQSDTDFEDLGLHSMATLKIMAAFRRKTGVELPVGIFAENGTVGRLKAALHDVLEEQTSTEEAALPKRNPSAARRPVPAVVATKPETSPSEPIPIAEMVATAPAPSEEVLVAPPVTPQSGSPPEGRVVLVQGDRASPLPPVFMATAGIGLAAPYIRFPRLPNGRPIYALESPFVECPDLHPHSAEGMAEAWIRSLKKMARRGPYIVGGCESMEAQINRKSADRVIEQTPQAAHTPTRSLDN